MEYGREASHSLWQSAELPFLPGLNCHQTADVCVIGAGIAGLTTAYHLLAEGRSVVVLERDGIGLGQTGLTSAHLSSALDETYTALLRLHGPEKTRLAAQSHRAAIDEIERIVAAEKIACGFERVSGYVFLSPDREESWLSRELEAAKQAGFSDVELMPQAPGSFFPTGPCLHYPRQAQFQPLEYLAGLLRAVRQRGGKVYAHTEAEMIEGGRPARVTTARGYQVVCGSIVVAANVPFNDRVTMHTKMAPYRSYVIGVRAPELKNPPALYWDTAEPYHYVRSARDATGPLLLVGGEDHRTGQDPAGEDHFEALHQWARSRLNAEGEVVEKWSGQVLESHDGLAYIGRNPGDEKNVYIVTGDSGHGLTHGTIAGSLLRDLILGRANEWEEVYDPARVNLRSLGTYLSEAAQSTAPYGDWLSPGDVSSLQEIEPGEGGVVRDGIQKVAVYKDHHGHPHFYSAVCPHLNGIVRWNGTEKTWDCPCHGSRFDKHGRVLNGPAPCGLREIVPAAVMQDDRASA